MGITNQLLTGMILQVQGLWIFWVELHSPKTEPRKTLKNDVVEEDLPASTIQ